MLGSYDSPTFLSQKDKYMLGLSLPQVMAVMGIAGAWFLATLGLPWELPIRLMITLGLTGVCALILFARIQGLLIPTFCFLFVWRIFVKPAYEDLQEDLLQGSAAWREQQTAKVVQLESGDKKAKAFGFMAGKRRRLAEDDMTAKREELEQEAKKQTEQALQAGEAWLRDGIKAVFKSG